MQRLVVGASWELCFSNLLRHIRFEYLEKCLTASNLGYFKKRKKKHGSEKLNMYENQDRDKYCYPPSISRVTIKIYIHIYTAFLGMIK